MIIFDWLTRYAAGDDTAYNFAVMTYQVFFLFCFFISGAVMFQIWVSSIVLWIRAGGFKREGLTHFSELWSSAHWPRFVTFWARPCKHFHIYTQRANSNTDLAAANTSTIITDLRKCQNLRPGPSSMPYFSLHICMGTVKVKDQLWCLCPTVRVVAALPANFAVFHDFVSPSVQGLFYPNLGLIEPINLPSEFANLASCICTFVAYP